MSQLHLSEIVVEQLTSKQMANESLLLKKSIEAVKFLTFQGISFSVPHDDVPESRNQGNFVELLNLAASYDDNLAAAMLEIGPQEILQTSHKLQKDVLTILARKVRSEILEAIGDAKYCIIVDEVSNGGEKLQIAIVLRFVDKDGFVRDHLFYHAYISSDFEASFLNQDISAILSQQGLEIKDIRGQGYTGARNLGDWSKLKTLFCNDCPCAYYVPCLAHPVHLALIGAASECARVALFFNNLTKIVKIVDVPCKQHDASKAAEAAEIAKMLAINELKSGHGLNQIGTSEGSGDTRCASHFNAVCELIKLYSRTCLVLEDIMSNAAYCDDHGNAYTAYDDLTSFEFVFLLHLMKAVMAITNDLCQFLHRNSQDIENAMRLVETTKDLLLQLREIGWDSFWETVKSFYQEEVRDIPDMKALKTVGRGASRHQITMEHFFHTHLFTAVIDSQIQELNSRFSGDATELLLLHSALDPRDGYVLFKPDYICKAVDKFYPEDFTGVEKELLKTELEHYGCNVPKHPDLRNLSTVPELCEGFARTKMSTVYPLIDRLICLLLTLPISTTTAEQAFSTLKTVKAELQNEVEDDLLPDYLVTHVEQEIARTITTDLIIDELSCMEEH